LSEAKADPEGVVILEGDYGGQIYVVVQAEQVLCSQKTLSWLLHDVDRISWPGSYDDSARIVFERVAAGAPVAGGMGGGIATRDAWIHPELVRLGLDDEIRAVLRGEIDRLSAKCRAKRRPRRTSLCREAEECGFARERRRVASKLSACPYDFTTS
jgi:hypothetical protein